MPQAYSNLDVNSSESEKNSFMSGVFSLLYRKWLGKLEYLLIAVSILSFIASFSGNNIFTISTPIFLFLSLHANISKQKYLHESRQPQDRFFQLEQLVLSRDANLADIQATLSEIDKLYLDFSQIQQRFVIIEDFLKSYRLDTQNLNLQQLLNGLEANIKRTERQYNQGQILESQLILQEQITHIEEQLLYNLENHTPAPDNLQTLTQQIQDLSDRVVSYSDIQAEDRVQQSQVNEKIQKLERQFNSLPFIEFLNRIAQLEELNEQVKNSLTESKRVTKSLKGEVELVSQKLQCIIATAATAQTENCDRQPSSELQASYEQNAEMTQRLAKEVSSLRKQTQAILSSLSARITQLRIEVDKQHHSEISPAKIPVNTDELATWAGEFGDRIPK
ncbi:hypothetical protein [Chroococcidiopsis sp. CCNUC1]|uniref:hypothetical protein n=1 Tax=Chroococcidiopsis sp. CCNUC1 TaxID=2653189 RepID=UPI00201FE253|nr:hypothetical protein [Chroococcidiopsis sp. CCNUC1]URD53213.1 hypothetical protein M5J74_14715 [Chroococcidiopsis sp. CCNUC1]